MCVQEAPLQTEDLNPLKVEESVAARPPRTHRGQFSSFEGQISVFTDAQFKFVATRAGATHACGQMLTSGPQPEEVPLLETMLEMSPGATRRQHVTINKEKDGDRPSQETTLTITTSCSPTC